LRQNRFQGSQGMYDQNRRSRKILDIVKKNECFKKNNVPRQFRVDDGTVRGVVHDARQPHVRAVHHAAHVEGVEALVQRFHSAST